MRQMEQNKSDSLLAPGILLILDRHGALSGILTNGDIRRAFAAGITMADSVSHAMNPDPSVIVAVPGETNLLTLLFDKIKAEQWPAGRLEKIIIVDEKRRVTDVVSFYDLVRRSDVRFKHIGIVGLGYVGLTLGLTLADVGFRVKGLDHNPGLVAGLRKGVAPFFEKGLDRLIADHLNKNFRIADDFRGGNNCDVYFIAVGTPLDAKKRPDLTFLKSAASAIGSVLKSGDVVILRSTVPLGVTRDTVRPILEHVSGMRAGEGFLLAFAPERTVEGRALEELRELPQVIGGINRVSTDAAAQIFNYLASSTVLVSSLEAAEMVKLVNNTYRDVMFAFANEVSLVAGAWGVSAKEVIDAANYGYSRSNVPLPSPGVGGYCLEKDPFIFIESARRKGHTLALARDARMISDRMVARVAGDIISFLKTEKSAVKNPNIVVLGLAFKGRPVTSDTRGSTSVAVVEILKKEGYFNIHVYDPAVGEKEIARHGVIPAGDSARALRGADVVAVLTNHPDFEALDIRKLLESAQKPVLLYDAWSLYAPDEIGKVEGVSHMRL